MQAGLRISGHNSGFNPKASRVRAIITTISLGLMLGLSSCATDPRTTGSIKRGGDISKMSVPELKSAVGQYGTNYARNPKDKAVGLTYAAMLRRIGRHEQALSVMQKMVIYHPQDPQVLAAYGKALAAAGDLSKALKIIERAQTPDHPDWKLLSAQGAILDQLDRSNEARRLYRSALDLRPNEPSVLSNLGMSYLLTGDLPASETYLRQAIKLGGGDSRIRQNLALVVGLQGRFQEAETIARGELGNGEAQENVAYLRKMLAQQNSWKELEKQDANNQSG